MRAALLALALPALATVTGCVSLPDPSKAVITSPRLQLEDYFVGRTYAAGIFENRGDNIARTLYVTLDGTWNEATQTLVLDERFRYNDGETDRRVWTFRKQPDGGYIGTAADVNGEARVTQSGAGAVFTYLVDLKLSEGRSIEVRFSDRLWLLEGGMMINRATVSKYGFRVGEATITFFKQAPAGFPMP
jgi:hypothetical protein